MRTLSIAVLVLLCAGSILAGETTFSEAVEAASDPLAALKVEIAAPDWTKLPLKDEKRSLDALLELPNTNAPDFEATVLPLPITNSWTTSEELKIERCKNQLRTHFATFLRFQRIGWTHATEQLDKLLPLSGHFVYVPGEHTAKLRTVVAFCKCACHDGKGRCVLTSDGKVDWVTDSTQVKKDVSETLKHLNIPVDFTNSFTLPQLQQALADLNHEDFDMREQAAAILARGSPTAIRLLLAGSESTEKEVAHRCKQILHLLGRSRIVLIREEFDARKEE